jgi:hypothetical protein
MQLQLVRSLKLQADAREHSKAELRSRVLSKIKTNLYSMLFVFSRIHQFVGLLRCGCGNVAWGACDVRKAVQWWEKMRAEDRRAMG